MYQQWGGGSYYSNFGAGGYGWAQGVLPFWVAILAPWLVLLVIWSVFWKGLCLWHSAQRGSYWWFFVMLVVNTAGILELIYLFGIAKLRFSELFSSRVHHR